MRTPTKSASPSTKPSKVSSGYIHHALTLLGLATLCGCEFFITPPEPEPDPATDGILACGEQMSVDGLEAGTTIPVDVPQGTSVEVLMGFGDPGQIGRLRVDSDTSLSRALPVWDPVLERAVIPGYRGTGEDLTLELLGAGSDGFSGSVSLQCTSPGEICFNLSDDDGDTLVDCADIHCARDPRCADDQHDLDERVLSCDEQVQQLDPPELRSFDDQRTLYIRPETDFPEFWGGAELTLGATLGSGTVEVTFGEAGMVCVGEATEDTVVCDVALDVSSGETRSFPTEDLPLRIEPLGPGWIDLRARLVCD